MLLSCGAGWNPAAGWQPAWSAGCQPARSLTICPTKERILAVTDLTLEGRDVHPAVLGVAFHLGFENGQLAQPVDELGVVGSRGGIRDRLVEAAEDLLEGIVVAFAVAAR